MDKIQIARRQTVVFLSRVASQYNEDFFAGSSVLPSQALPGNHITPHSAPMLGEFGDSKLRSDLLYSKFTVSIYWHPPVLSSLWKYFHLQKKNLQLNLCRKKVLAFLILPGTNTSRTIQVYPFTLNRSHLGIPGSQDSRDSNAKSHEGNWSAMNCGQTHSLKCCPLPLAESFYQFRFTIDYLWFIGSSSGILYAFNFNNGDILVIKYTFIKRSWSL